MIRPILLKARRDRGGMQVVDGEALVLQFLPEVGGGCEDEEQALGVPRT